LAEVGEQLSVHGEIFSPFTQLLELFGYEQALMYLIDEPDKCRAILAAYAQGAADLGARQARRGVDAVLISSAFAGGGFISPRQYRHFVLPYEAEVVGRLLAGLAEVKVTATFCLKGPQGASHKRWLSPFPCGDIGDRLELMAETGIDGIDTLDPPPLGSVDLEDAKRRVGDRVFFKGNIDPLGTLLTKPRQEVREDALWRLKVGSRRGGYILSSACSVSPRVKVTATFCLKGPQGAPHKRWLSPFPTVLVEASEGFGTPKT
jgi:uroporphyrinogen-III decarboxylase